jgi:hypothetical protein
MIPQVSRFDDGLKCLDGDSSCVRVYNTGSLLVRCWVPDVTGQVMYSYPFGSGFSSYMFIPTGHYFCIDIFLNSSSEWRTIFCDGNRTGECQTCFPSKMKSRYEVAAKDLYLLISVPIYLSADILILIFYIIFARPLTNGARVTAMIVAVLDLIFSLPMLLVTGKYFYLVLNMALLCFAFKAIVASGILILLILHLRRGNGSLEEERIPRASLNTSDTPNEQQDE